MRGTPNGCMTTCIQTGIIPAHAGNTLFLSFRSFSNRDHPRACGEHGYVHVWGGDVAGSSPRMRGTLTVLFFGLTEDGDHPRACGEHQMNKSRKFSMRGSSPRMRGTHAVDLFSSAINGIIPAHAGNTCQRRRRSPWIRDHPRACGEHAWMKLS